MKISRILAVALMVVEHPAFSQTKSEIEGRLTPMVHECERAPENGGTLEQAICYKDEAARQDKRLNDTWKRVTADLPAFKFKTLKRNERLWIAEREQECRREERLYINSTAAYMYNSCVARENIRRTIWLERGARGSFAIPKQLAA